MATSESKALERPSWPAAWPFYYGWVNVLVAALAMTATLAGRTHGLGLITTPLLEDLQLGEARFSHFNFWAVILGSLFCIPVGRWIDRWGTRPVSTLVVIALGAAVVLMSLVKEELALCGALLMVRGLGQTALSVVSMSMVGKWFRRRLGPAMGVYAVLLAIGFIASVLGVGSAVQDYGWRPAWQGMGLALVLVLGPLCWILVRNSPESCGLKDQDEPLNEGTAPVQRDLCLGEALRTPAFWVVSLGTSLFGLIWSAITLFNQSILEGHGFGAQTFLMVMAILTGSGLVSNLLGGWLATRTSPGRLLGASLMVLAAALLVFPIIRSREQLVDYALTLGVAGGMITVIFFAFYGQAFGQAHLGRIQGTAQILSVLASAMGPVLLTLCKDQSGSYDPIFSAWAPIAAILGIAAWRMRLPPRPALPQPGAIHA